MSKGGSAGARRRARELIVQALYQKQLTGYDAAELIKQFKARDEYQRADTAYFDEMLPVICEEQTELEAKIGELADRPTSQLDPVELAVLLLGFFELGSRQDVPYRVVIDESINLAKRFGAEGGHKYVNAVLDKAAKKLRPAEASASAK
jgi:N utilization substance protein B